MNDIGIEESVSEYRSSEIEENKINKTEPFYHDDYVTLYQGDSREVLRTLPDASVNCCVTSPPSRPTLSSRVFSQDALLVVR